MVTEREVEGARHSFVPLKPSVMRARSDYLAVGVPLRHFALGSLKPTSIMSVFLVFTLATPIASFCGTPNVLLLCHGRVPTASCDD